ncbi:MAG: hypothetical protein FRX49_01765, partial [Trebouxia sp. A1-2]
VYLYDFASDALLQMLKKKLPPLPADAGDEVDESSRSKSPLVIKSTPAESDWRLEEGDKPSRALQVVKELHARYRKQTKRWQDYIRLFGFLVFVSLFLAVLFLQRNAQVAYQVHSTIENAILPTSTQYGSSDDVLNWLSTTLTAIWVDPVCGDGVCETPFEYASFGRFGCRADCGELAEVQNLTTLQIDLYYDFDHPTTSIASSLNEEYESYPDIRFTLSLQTLMDQAAWNLCPVSGVVSGSACYYADDQTFTDLSGTTTVVIDDCPDGKCFTLAFATHPAVRCCNWALVLRRDYFNKVAGGVRQQEKLDAHSELVKIRTAVSAADAQQDSEISDLQTVISLANETLFDLINATITANYTAQLDTLDTTYSDNTSDSTYMALRNATELEYEYTEAQFYQSVYSCDDVPYYDNSTELSTLTCTFLSAAAAEDFIDPTTGDTLNATAVCLFWLNEAEVVEAARISTIQTTLNQRLSTAATAGDTALTDDITTITDDTPEVAVVILADTGADPLNYPYLCAISTLADYYVEGPYTVPPPARAALASTYVSSGNLTLANYISRSQARITELDTARATVQARAEVVIANNEDPTSATYSYNYVAWTGGADAYQTCDLSDRASTYVGTCTTAGFVTFNTTLTTDTTDTSLTDVTYSCSDGSSSATCAAEADQLNCHGRLLQTRQLMQSSPPPPPPPSQEEETLEQILAAVTTLQTGQTTLQTDIDALQVQVDAANAAATANAEDTSLEALITAGRADIATGQATVESLLNKIIGEQDTAAAAEAAAASALAAIESLTTQQEAAAASIASAYTSSLESIEVALQQGTISLSVATELFKTARLTKAESTKDATLANDPCTENEDDYTFSVANYNDTVASSARERYLGLTNRVIAGMLLQTTRTTPVNCTDSRFSDIESLCKGGPDLAAYGVDPVFKSGTDLYNSDLDDETDTVSFYNCSTLGYNATYNIPNTDTAVTVTAPATAAASTLYCAQTSATSNPEPYCAELYNARDLPYGFFSFDLPQLFGQGFPVFFDINLSADDVQSFYEYVQEGLYYDSNTRLSQAQFVTYNPELQIFSSSVISFDFTDGGSILQCQGVGGMQVTYSIHTVRVELYESSGDYVRLVLEILLTIWVCIHLFSEFWAIIQARRRQGSFLLYFKSPWNIVDFLSTALLFACVIVWWDFALRDALPFDIDLRYDVYANLEAEAAFLKLNDNGVYLLQLQAAFAKLQVVDLNGFVVVQYLVNKLAWYYALNGINILLLIGRVLKRMDFQPRLGVVTRSLALAGPDLIHFCLVCGMVFVGYAMMAHLIFGNTIQQFSTFGTAVNTCFAILLGDISVNDDLNQLQGLQGVAATLFFWSFELLVFMVLLNFLLAIIVDAFSEVKENTHETTGLHTEVGQMVREKWRSMLASCCHGTSYVPDKRLGQLLQQWGGDDEEGVGQAEKEGGERERRLKVLGEDLTAEELKEVLQACLRDAHPSGQAEEKRRGGLIGCFRPRRHSKLASEEELDKAAQYVVARFGAYDNEDEDEEEEEGAEELEGKKKKEKGGVNDALLEKERDQLANALERLADVQRELAEGQRSLMTGQRQLQEQQQRLVSMMSPAATAPPARQGLTASGSIVAPPTRP